MDADVRSQLLEEASEYLKVEEDDVVFNLAFDAAIESCKEAVHLSLIENEEVTGQSGHVRNCLNQVKIS